MFKIDDKVVIVDTPYMAEELSVGKTGVVVATNDGCDMFAVKMDSGWLSEIGYWNFLESELELISV